MQRSDATPKVFWLKPTSNVFKRSYLLCLATVQELNAAEVEHFKPDRYYNRLLNKTKDSIQADVGIGMTVKLCKLKKDRKQKKQSEAKAAAKQKQDVKPKPKLCRDVNPNSYFFGRGFMTFKPPATWQATCPRTKGGHRDPKCKTTLCRQSRSFKTEDESKEVQLCLKHWINCCKDFACKSDHQGWRPKYDELPDEEVIECLKLPDDWRSDSENEEVHQIHGKRKANHISAKVK